MGSSQGYIGKMPKCGCIVGAFALTGSSKRTIEWLGRFIRDGLIIEYVEDVSQVKLVDCKHNDQHAGNDT